jgi:hypothetical protein
MRLSGWLAWKIGAVAVLAAPASLALVTEPDGSTVPRDSGGSETQIYTMFQQRGESPPLDWQQDGKDVPDTFSPLCEFSAEFLLREAGGQSPFGWYNVVPGSTTPPAAGQIYEIVSCNTAPGTVINSATIRQHPSYQGGLVGFAIANGSGCVSFNNPGSISQIHYTEKKFNVLHLNGQPWTMAIVYDSKVEPNAFYIAFEDGKPNGFAFNNDGDFNDFVVLVRGLVCPGGGAPCDTGLQGVCGPGVQQCRDGQLTCEGLFPPGATETCDGLDNDCDGAIDNGDLCPAEKVCDNGVCVEKCGGGEFVCPSDKACNAKGLCVDPLCIPVTCQATEICVAGTCKQACQGVVCPRGQTCRLGACVDPCATVSCGQNQVCVEGVCRDACNCLPCAAGLECSATGTGLCVEAGCGAVTCPGGTWCQAGNCVDACQGAVCPAGQKCETGNCVPDPAAGGAGGSGGTASIDGGIGATGGSFGGIGATGGSGATGAGSGGASGGSGSTFGPKENPEQQTGCLCATPARPGGEGGLIAQLILIAIGALRRRRASP